MFQSTTEIVSSIQWLAFALPFLFIVPTLLTRLLASPRKSATPDLAEINRKLDLLIKHAGIRDNPLTRYQLPNPALQDQLSDAIRRGKKLTAIQIYRNATSSSLRDAKSAVEDMIRSYRSNPAATD